MSKEEGIFCSTAGHVFKDKAAFTEHYKSDFHLYNLKRRVAGLPPVTKEWFEERKTQIVKSTKRKTKQQIWTDPLTKKKFQSESTYLAFIQSKKYQSLLKQSDLSVAPDAVVADKPTKNSEPTKEEVDKEETEVRSVKEWDVAVSLFDGHKSASFESNLEYMFKRFGFFFPNSEFLDDAEGLLKYLGAKLSDGHIPLYCSGLNPDAKEFVSLKAVQNHMIDTRKCTMLFEGNEEEYEDFYNLDALFETESGMELALGVNADAFAGFEITVRDGSDGRSKSLGNRAFLYLYKQRHRPFDRRDSVLMGQLIEKYRALGVRTRELVPDDVKRSRKQEAARRSWTRMKTDMRSNMTNNLPRNVPY